MCSDLSASVYEGSARNRAGCTCASRFFVQVLRDGGHILRTLSTVSELGCRTGVLECRTTGKVSGYPAKGRWFSPPILTIMLNTNKTGVDCFILSRKPSYIMNVKMRDFQTSKVLHVNVTDFKALVP